jgi:hypothetical protein
MELLDVCLTITYFQFGDKFYQQKDGMAMENSISVGLQYIMECLEKIALDTNQQSGLYMLTCSWFSLMDYQDCSNFFSTLTHLSLSRISQWQLKITTLPFFDVMVMKGSPKLATKVYNKHHTICYPHF